MKQTVKRTSKRTAGSRKRSSTRASRAPLAQALAAFAALAAREQIRWYVFGAQAVALHGFPRATADLDITIDLGDRPLAPLLAKLTRAGFVARFADAAFVAATRVLPVTHTASRLPIDLVLAGPGLEQIFLDRVDEHIVGRHAIPVLCIEDLVVTKLLASRPKDLQDIRELLAISTIRHAVVVDLLGTIEEALDRSDLAPAYAQLRTEVAAIKGDRVTRKPARARKAR